MKNVIIVHGCPSNKEKAKSSETRTYDKHWMPWLKQKLTAKGIPVEAPLMPNPWTPVYEDFKQEFEKSHVNEDTVLVGHSCGGAFLIRWLGETKIKVSKLVLVAPWRIPDQRDKARKAFYEYPIDGKIKSRVKEIVMFISDDEAEDGKKSLDIYHQAIGGDIIELKSKGHFTLDGMGTTEFPELLEAILS